ncbi:MAG: response regulator [Saprospiraceae bacterium]|nr:response regulator [Saprospiraceae bacterium]
MQEPEKIRVLYVDDESVNLTAFKASFRRDFEVFVALSGPEAMEILEKQDMEVIITDQRMPEMSGVEFLEKVIPLHPEPIRILLTGYSDIQAVIDAINKGQVYHYITKPWDESQLRNIIHKAYEVFALRRENKELIKSLLRANEQLEFLLRQRLLS